MFINHDYIYQLLEDSKAVSDQEISCILDKAEAKKGLNHQEIAALLQTQNPDHIQRIFHIAGKLKQAIYGNRIVVFAPLYISDYCVNNCTYCGYKRDNGFPRRKLSYDEIQSEVKLLEKMGHKRLALELGEDPLNCPIDYVLDSIDAIYSTKLDNGAIRRINVNVAATSTENYQKLHEKGIGTYILFQETYHQPTYEAVHPQSLKGDYTYHLTAFDRAMTGGIDDVGGGVLFGLYDYRFEVLSLMLHNEHLEETFGVGFHTISVPRLKKAEGMALDEFPHIVTDDEFKKIVALIRLAVPFTGIILSTRESVAMRQEVIQYGVSQVSAGSCTGVGGYQAQEDGDSTTQFEVADHRSPMEVIHSLIDNGYIPSYCTACYRKGRTGDRFMRLAKSGQIQYVCQPNALMTLMEYALDYGDPALIEKAEALVAKEAAGMDREDLKALLLENIEKLKQGQRDLFL